MVRPPWAGGATQQYNSQPLPSLAEPRLCAVLVPPFSVRARLQPLPLVPLGCSCTCLVLCGACWSAGVRVLAPFIVCPPPHVCYVDKGRWVRAWLQAAQVSCPTRHKPSRGYAGGIQELACSRTPHTTGRLHYTAGVSRECALQAGRAARYACQRQPACQFSMGHQGDRAGCVIGGLPLLSCAGRHVAHGAVIWPCAGPVTVLLATHVCVYVCVCVCRLAPLHNGAAVIPAASS
jgi:hypothetical protein